MTRLGTNWLQYAACSTVEPEVFFPVGTTDNSLIKVDRAKRVCARCPVREACLRWAVALEVDHGVFGGLSEDERKAIKRRSARKRRSPGSPD
jgi:WhiB family redox-sensing transcriptional regulator